MDASQMPRRPRCSDDEVLRRVVDEVIGEFPPGDSAETRADLLEALRVTAPIFDPYEMAKHLDQRCGWLCNMEVVNACEIAEGATYAHYHDVVAEWVTANGVRPSKTVGTHVFQVETRGPNGQHGHFDGEIVAIDARRGTYTVMFPEMGHVREGAGTHGIIFPFEAIDQAPEKPVSATVSKGLSMTVAPGLSQ